MKILVDNGNYQLVNLGDIAMMDVFVQRIMAMFGNPEIMLVTRNPDAAARQFPGITPVDPHLLVPSARPLNRLARWRRKAGVRVGVPRPAPTEIPLIDGVDAVLFSGCGFLNDHFSFGAAMRLRRLLYAAKRGKVVALFGQGVGPVSAPALRQAMAATLPLADLIGVRERVEAPRILREVGVAQERIAVVGDDATELAFRRCREHPAALRIGVGVRAAPYAGIGKAEAHLLADSLARVLGEHGAQAVPIPITFQSEFSDRTTLQRLLACSVPGMGDMTVDRIIDDVGSCGVVVSGTYHAAVFALAQGIPVVGIYANDYYRTKLHGLFDMYGWSEENLLHVQQADFSGLLATRVRDLLIHKDRFTTPLRDAARHQIHASRDSYSRLAVLLGGAPLPPFRKAV
ncbi:MAG: polysaccharide pyruvyl transferase family protein [Verrucomicrobia bacterium]|nr:polysaccharide pyruvyl transferase family protein [Verrucomicrobiota bacterium]MBT7067823.1 polysaccharide pyruvyl transferase family protein [Verrucomicrobiota bacterium]MBT7701967.1 polysaccharide pyruvyl transferase family protein [Verrucomicrobiota bacterium]